MRYVVFLFLLFTVAPALGAACSIESAAEHPHVIELYTAEGCSSCPPAEQWMSTLRDKTNVIGLEFHVDYWDSLGWPDPFADARYTDRQKALARHGSQVYTPQIALDGRVWKNWPKGTPPEEPHVQAPALKLAVEPGTPIRIEIESAASDAPKSWGVYAALVENGLTSKVIAGENKGKSLAHDLVVRDLAGPLPLARAEATLKPPPAFDAAKASVVALVQDSASGDIVQAVRVPLAACAP